MNCDLWQWPNLSNPWKIEGSCSGTSHSRGGWKLLLFLTVRSVSRKTRRSRCNALCKYVFAWTYCGVESCYASESLAWSAGKLSWHHRHSSDCACKVVVMFDLCASVNDLDFLCRWSFGTMSVLQDRAKKWSAFYIVFGTNREEGYFWEHLKNLIVLWVLINQA